MRTNITAFLPVIGFCGRLPALDLGSGSPSQEGLSRGNEVPAHAEVGGPDAYKLAVVLLVGAAILSLFS
jgi:hypothetical protein